MASPRPLRHDVRPRGVIFVMGGKTIAAAFVNRGEEGLDIPKYLLR
jgi:hypothetical protein